MIDRGETTVERVRRMIGLSEELTAREVADVLSDDERNAMTLGFRGGLQHYASHSQERVVLALADDHGLAYYWERPGGGAFKSGGSWWLPLGDRGVEVAKILQARLREKVRRREREQGQEA